MNIKNYTTSISASRTITEIEELLVNAGASAIMKTYRGDGRVEALTFKYQERGYKLPANTEKVYEILKQKHRAGQALQEQAERVAWRVLKDWLHAQLSLIAIGQAEYEQVMLSYMWDGKQSFYEMVKERQFAIGTTTEPRPTLKEDKYLPTKSR